MSYDDWKTTEPDYVQGEPDDYEPEPRCPVCGAEDDCDIDCDCVLCVHRRARQAAQAALRRQGAA